MAKLHPTSIVDSSAELADVEISSSGKFSFKVFSKSEMPSSFTMLLSGIGKISKYNVTPVSKILLQKMMELVLRLAIIY